MIARGTSPLVAARDRVDPHFHDIDGVRPLAGVEVLPVHSDGARGFGRDDVAHLLPFRASGAVRSFPIHPVTHRAAATVRRAAFAFDAEDDSELVLVQTHHHG